MLTFVQIIIYLVFIGTHQTNYVALTDNKAEIIKDVAYSIQAHNGVMWYKAITFRICLITTTALFLLWYHNNNMRLLSYGSQNW